MRSSALLVLSLLIAPAAAQQPSSTSGGTITGAVYCEDTNTPARFAEVLLKPATIDPAAAEEYTKQMQLYLPPSGTDSVAGSSQMPPELQQSILKSINRQANSQSEQANSSTADVNGHYTLSGIEPGSYYIHVEMPGYVDPLDQFTFDEITTSDPDLRARVAERVPMVHITGNDTVRIDLRLERGASVTGRILYDDGAPAIGWTVSAVPKRNLTRKHTPGDFDPMDQGVFELSGFVGFSVNGPPPRTDDLGIFRISGLAAGDYALRAVLMARTPGAKGNIGIAGVNLTVYSGDTLHIANAKTFSVAAGELRPGSDLTVPLRSLHGIRGHIVAKSDGHGLNGGVVVLSTKDDPTLHQTSALQDIGDGSFQFYSLPPGTYALTVIGASDIKTTVTKIATQTRSTSQPTHHYGSISTSVALGDIDLDSITLTAPEANGNDPNIIDLTLPDDDDGSGSSVSTHSVLESSGK